MKKHKIFIISLFFLSLFWQKAFAVGQIELDDFSSTFDVVVGQDFNKYISFYYSGTEYKPSASLSTRGSFPAGLRLGSPIYEGNGLYNVLYSGVPEIAGTHNLTLTITDNYGALVNKKITVNSIGLTFPETTLPKGYIGVPYVQKIKYTYPGKDGLRIRMRNLPEGFYDITKNPNSDNGYFEIGLNPYKLGQFKINLEATLNGKIVGSGVFDISIENRTQDNKQVEVPVVVPKQEVIKEDPIKSLLNKTKVKTSNKDYNPEPKDIKKEIVPTDNLTTLAPQEDKKTEIVQIQNIQKVPWYRRLLKFMSKK